MEPIDTLNAGIGIFKQRGEQHGDYKDNMRMVAGMWSAYVGTKISPRDVCNMMAMFKQMRSKFSDNDDNALDGAVYTAMSGSLERE